MVDGKRVGLGRDFPRLAPEHQRAVRWSIVTAHLMAANPMLRCQGASDHGFGPTARIRQVEGGARLRLLEMRGFSSSAARK